MKSWIAVVLVAAAPAFAEDEIECNGGRVARGQTLLYTYTDKAEEVAIEKDGKLKGKAVKRKGKWQVEIGGKVQASFTEGYGGKIEKGGAEWSTIKEATKVFDCTHNVAATLWVLTQKGAL